MLATWTLPASPRGNLTRFDLFLNSSSGSSAAYSGLGSSAQLTVQPYTSYSARVVFYNSVGQAASDYVSFMTPQEGDALPFVSLNLVCFCLLSYKFPTQSTCSIVCVLFRFSSSPLLTWTAPTGLAAPSLQALSSSSLAVSWTAPSSPNGVLLSATVNVDQTSVNVDASALSLVVSDLTHFQLYTVSVTYCTVGGCTTGPSATQTTLKDG